MFCSRCDASNDATDKFCKACGHSLNALASPDAQSATTANTLNTLASTADDTELLRSFVGDKYAHYAAIWHKHEGVARFISWHWPAFLLPVAWLGYRKMYSYACVAIGASLVLAAFSGAQGQFIPNWLVQLSIGAGFGANANRLYRDHALRKCAEIKQTSLASKDQLVAAHLAGGKSLWLGIGMLLANFAAIGIVFAMIYGK